MRKPGLCYGDAVTMNLSIAGAHRVKVDVLAADGHQDLADGHARGGALCLAEGAAHARLQPIRAGA